MNTIFINKEAKRAIESHAIGRSLELGSFKQIAKDTWAVKVPHSLEKRFKGVGDQLRNQGKSASFSDIILHITEAT